jgi:hypothetical protein
MGILRRSSGVGTLGTLTLVLGLAAGGWAGVALASPDQSGPAQPPPDGVLIDVVHNPPIFAESDHSTELVFRPVCLGVACPSSSGTLTLTDFKGAVHTYTQTAKKDEPIVFTVAPELLAGGQVTYSGEFTGGSGTAALTWPDVGSAPASLQPFRADRTIELGTADFAAQESRGTSVFQATWGTGGDQVGVEDGVGPTSFDVEPDGTVHVLDFINSRLIRADSTGNRQSAKIVLPKDFPDIAAEDDGTVDVLYPNGAGTGRSYVDRFDPQGALIETVPILGRRSYNIRRQSGTVKVGAEQRVTDVIVKGRALGKNDQVRHTTSVHGRTGSSVLSKHVSDDVVRVALLDDHTGQATTSWEVRSATRLGPIALAEPVAGGVLLVQSQFTDQASRFVAVFLTRNGAVRITPLPDRRFVEVTAGSEFRLVGNTLYAARSNAQQFEIASYPLEDLGVK